MLFHQDSMSSELTFFQVAALYQRVSALKQKQNGLEVWISVVAGHSTIQAQQLPLFQTLRVQNPRRVLSSSL
jgi:hypothetical protein